MKTIDTWAKWIGGSILGLAVGYVIIQATIAEPVGAFLWLGLASGAWLLARRFWPGRKPVEEDEPEPESV